MEPVPVNNNICQTCSKKLLTESSKQAKKCSDCRIGNGRVNLKEWNLTEGRFETVKSGYYRVPKQGESDSILLSDIASAYPFSIESRKKDEGKEPNL